MTSLTDRPTRTTSVLARAPMLALVWSVAATALGATWLFDDATYPFRPGLDAADLSLLGGLEPRLGASLLMLVAALGVTTALLARLRPRRSRPLLVASTGLAITFGVLVPDIQLLIVAGYLVALSVPLVAVVALLLCLRSPRRAGFAAVGAAAFATWAWQTGAADAEALGSLGDGLGTGFARLGIRPFVLLFFLAGGAIWAAVAAGTYGRFGGLAGATWARPESAARWGRVATLVAAACALPYGLMRMTWLTPWPLGFDPDDFASSPGIRIFGLLLGCAALSGAVLTLGLISRWGEIWPRWIPVLRGRPVPIVAAVVPGATIAALFTMSGVSLTRSIVEEQQYVFLVIFPFLLWGPALAAATLAYYLRRRPVTR